MWGDRCVTQFCRAALRLLTSAGSRRVVVLRLSVCVRALRPAVVLPSFCFRRAQLAAVVLLLSRRHAEVLVVTSYRLLLWSCSHFVVDALSCCCVFATSRTAVVLLYSSCRVAVVQRSFSRSAAVVQMKFCCSSLSFCGFLLSCVLCALRRAVGTLLACSRPDVVCFCYLTCHCCPIPLSICRRLAACFRPAFDLLSCCAPLGLVLLACSRLAVVLPSFRVGPAVVLSSWLSVVLLPAVNPLSSRSYRSPVVL